MEIFKFEKTHQEAFYELCKEFYNTHATIRNFIEEIAAKTFERILDNHENLWGYMFIDKDYQTFIGYALITSYWCNEEGGEVIILDELYIKPDCQKRGYAALFLNWLEERYQHCTSITLEVLTTNQNAIHLYEKIGYKPDGFMTYTKNIPKK